MGGVRIRAASGARGNGQSSRDTGATRAEESPSTGDKRHDMANQPTIRKGEKHQQRWRARELDLHFLVFSNVRTNSMVYAGLLVYECIYKAELGEDRIQI